ncbi:MAG: alkaline phosphatase family protein [Bacteroidetes bacterium]|nr:alkaline phosphatase family protein [Bacteroidota bacterium]
MKHILAVAFLGIAFSHTLLAPNAPALVALHTQSAKGISQHYDYQALALLRRFCPALRVHSLSQGTVMEATSEFVFVVTTDGMRWQEVFSGADPAVVETLDANTQAYCQQKYGAGDPEARRKKLMPFFWTILQQNAQIYGNRNFGNNMNVDNSMWFSYPGYNELFSGKADDRHIWSNSKKHNPNTNVFEFLNKQAGLQGKVAAFGSWDAFPYILNEERAGFMVNAGFEPRLDGPIDQEQLRLNSLQQITPATLHAGVRPDSLTWAFAKKYVNLAHPRVLFIGYGETDEYAHQGNYPAYLDAAHQFDAFLADLWRMIQQDPMYRGKTTLLITTDHGRGFKSNWKNHLPLLDGSNAIWCAVAGPGIKARGEIKSGMQLWQKQVAQTIAHCLGLKFQCAHTVAPAIREIFE